MKVIKETEEDHPLVNGVNGVDGPAEMTKQPHPLLRGTVSAPSIQSDVSPLYEEVGDMHPTPSRSAPAPPNSLPSQRQDKVKCVAQGHRAVPKVKCVARGLRAVQILYIIIDI